MPSLPPEFALIMIAFQPLFSNRVFYHAQVLLVGAILAPGERTVTAALRVMGLSGERRYHRYHRVLSLATWSPRKASARLVGLLIERFAPEGPLVFGLDDTIERRWGRKIKQRGIYRDAVRSSKGHFVKASGLRWLSLMLLVEIPWASRVWALPFLTVLCPSERYYQERGLRPKKLTDYARQMICQLKRWVPNRRLILTADSSFSAIELLAAARKHVTMVTRLRLDAALYEPAPERRPGQPGRPRKKGERLPSLEEVLSDPATRWIRFLASHWYGGGAYELDVATGEAVWYHGGMPAVPIRWVLTRDPKGKLAPKAFLSTDLEASPQEVLSWFVRRWQVEVTFEEVRRHLGVETQRQWSEKAIERTTPCLLGLFSLVVLMADSLAGSRTLSVRKAQWYAKEHPTFSDALAAVRQRWWTAWHLSMSQAQTETIKIPRPLFERLIQTISYSP